MSVNKYNASTGELTNLASGSRIWAGSKAAYDAQKQAGTLPNNCIICITDDEEELAQEVIKDDPRAVTSGAVYDALSGLNNEPTRITPESLAYSLEAGKSNILLEWQFPETGLYLVTFAGQFDGTALPSGSGNRWEAFCTATNAGTNIPAGQQYTRWCLTGFYRCTNTSTTQQASIYSQNARTGTFTSLYVRYIKIY